MWNKLLRVWLLWAVSLTYLFGIKVWRSRRICGGTVWPTIRIRSGLMCQHHFLKTVQQRLFQVQLFILQEKLLLGRFVLSKNRCIANRYSTNWTKYWCNAAVLSIKTVSHFSVSFLELFSKSVQFKEVESLLKLVKACESFQKLMRKCDNVFCESLRQVCLVKPKHGIAYVSLLLISFRDP